MSILSELRNFRDTRKYQEIIEKVINLDKSAYAPLELIQILDELLIAGWYSLQKNLSKNAANEMRDLSRNNNIQLTQRQLDNMKFVIPIEETYVTRNLIFIFSSYIEYSQDEKDVILKYFTEHDFKDPIFLAYGDSSLKWIKPPFVYVLNKLDVNKLDKLNVQVTLDINLDVYKTDEYSLVLKRWALNNHRVLFGLESEKDIKEIRSWDIFDTLIGRKCYYPFEIFNMVQEKLGVPTFVTVRTKCEKMTMSTYDDIYREMIKDYPEDLVLMLKEMEFNMELDQCFPIMENINQVKNNDILVSDTYYPEDRLRQLLQKVGLTSTPKIYASYGGKSKGYIWDLIKKDLFINKSIRTLSESAQIKKDPLIEQVNIRHTGDNQHSDVLMHKKFGINTVHFNPGYNQVENLISKFQPKLATRSRMLRLMNPYESNSVEWKLWNYQVDYNIPLLLMACKYLDQYCRSMGIRVLLFCTRDCSILIKLFQMFYPQYESIYFHSSRIANTKASPDYIKYIKSFLTNPKEVMIVDLCGTGLSGNDLYEKLGFPKRFYLLNLPRGLSDKYNIDYIIASREYNNSYLEIMNYDTIGCLEDVEFTNDKFVDIRQPVKYNTELLEYIPKILDLINKEGLTILNDLNLDNIKEFWHSLLKELNAHGDFLVNVFNHSIKE